MQFWGYKRKEGRAGIRNHVLILPTCACGSDRKNLLDHLSEMVFFCALYQHGLGLRTGFHTDCQFALSGSFWMAPGRRYHLHCRRHHLCFESSAVRCKAQKFRLT